MLSGVAIERNLVTALKMKVFISVHQHLSLLPDPSPWTECSQCHIGILAPMIHLTSPMG